MPDQPDETDLPADYTILEFIATRIAEPSTWRGITSICGAAGITVAPDCQSAIIAMVLAINGLINVIRKEKTGKTINTTGPVTVSGPATVTTEPKGEL